MYILPNSSYSHSSLLDCCNILLTGQSAYKIKPLQIIQNAAAHLIFDEPKTTHHTSVLCTGFMWLSASDSELDSCLHRHQLSCNAPTWISSAKNPTHRSSPQWSHDWLPDYTLSSIIPNIQKNTDDGTLPQLSVYFQIPYLIPIWHVSQKLNISSKATLLLMSSSAGTQLLSVTWQKLLTYIYPFVPYLGVALD